MWISINNTFNATRGAMQTKKNIVFSAAFVLFYIFSCTNIAGKMVSLQNGDFEYSLSGTFKPETFYGKNTSLLNNDNETDKRWFARHTLDMVFDVLYGRRTYGKPISEFFFSIRNKGVWGDPNSIASTTEVDTKILEAIGRPHKHAIPRHIMWIREGWLRFDLGKAVSLPFDKKHTFTIGAFSFELGRGIALGDAYAVGPESLGFYSDGAVDQYAFGIKFDGDICKDVLTYDFYVAILQNKSGGLSDTGAKVLGQEFGRLKTPARGFGKINFVVAGKLDWTVFDNDRLGKLVVEPYALFNHDPEQKVEFLADASAKLGTIGGALEFSGDNVEFGFDYAMNLGQQRVKGWDRNQIIEQNREGIATIVNSHVIGESEFNVVDAVDDTIILRTILVQEKIPYIDEGDAQKIINETFRDESQNGREIGRVSSVGFLPAAATPEADDGIVQPADTVVLKNLETSVGSRFRNPFTNKFEGWMFVADAAYWIYKKDLQIAAIVGVASGDDNPNFETKDGTFSGFIGLQELYSGKRVRSAFLLGGAGKLNRPLSTPTTNQAPSRFAQKISGFTNLVFVGTGLKYEPQDWEKGLKVHPNMIVFWQERPIGKARTYLGIESDIFIHYYMLENTKFFFVASIFFPGSHYTDRMGVSLVAAQDDELDRPDPTGFEQDRIPNLGNDIAYTFNVGIEYKF